MEISCSGLSVAGWQLTQRGCSMTLPASSKSATDRCFSSVIDWNDDAGLSSSFATTGLSWAREILETASPPLIARHTASEM
jgi:hypothetical protein